MGPPAEPWFDYGQLDYRSKDIADRDWGQFHLSDAI